VSVKYWLWLSALRQIGADRVCDLIDRFGTPENVFFADDADLRGVEGLNKAQLQELCLRDLAGAERVLEQCDRLGLRVLTMQDADYPERLKNIPSPPSVLYVKGRLPALDEEAALTVVGSRRATPYGLQATARLCYGLARAGMLIVSGLADGIDAQAHTGALQAGAPTVAVLGCGVDIVYPESNRALYEDIAAMGALISEYPPGTRPLGGHFPARNRILSGVSLGTLVVEAPQFSGSLITAGHALEQGRDVFAVPGNIDAPESAGSNRLIADSAAQLVTGPRDILNAYEALYPHKITLNDHRPQALIGYNKRPVQAEREPLALVADTVETPRRKAPRAPKKAESPKAVDLSERIKDFTPDQKAIMIAIAGQPRHVDEIVEQTDLPASRVLRALTLLELNGAVKQRPGKRFEIAED
jgi:DNA processing protein